MFSRGKQQVDDNDKCSLIMFSEFRCTINCERIPQHWNLKVALNCHQISMENDTNDISRNLKCSDIEV